MNASKIYLVLTLLLISLFYNCTTNEDNIAEINHFMHTVDEFYEAVNTGNTDKRLSMFTPDAKMLPNFGEIMVECEGFKLLGKGRELDSLI